MPLFLFLSVRTLSIGFKPIKFSEKIFCVLVKPSSVVIIDLMQYKVQLLANQWALCPGGHCKKTNLSVTNLQPNSHSCAFRSILVVKSFWNFALSMAAWVPCPVQNVKMIGQVIKCPQKDIWVMIGMRLLSYSATTHRIWFWRRSSGCQVRWGKHHNKISITTISLAVVKWMTSL